MWTASKNTSGYGHIFKEGKLFASHRLSWVLHKGEIPVGMCVLHSCDNPACVNPKHLFLGTHFDNMRDMTEKGRSAHNNGAASGHAKLSEQDVHEIRALLDAGYEPDEISIGYGMSKSAIEHIKYRRSWGWLKRRN